MKFKCGDKARIFGVNDDPICNQIVKVVGVSATYTGAISICNHYIVELEKPRDGWTHISITEACLETC